MTLELRSRSEVTEVSIITGAGPHQVSLQPGSYPVLATKNGQPVKVDQEVVTISRGGRQVVRVSLDSRVAASARHEVRYGPWQLLFNAKDLTGWETSETTEKAPPQWRVEDKILISGGPPGYLFSERSNYGDFHLRAEARINSGGNSGILIRTTQGPGIFRPGYEAQICADVAGQIKTGSIGKLPPWQPVAVIDPSPAPADTWFDLEIIARGPKIQVKVNGATTAEYSDPVNAHQSGRIGLQHHDSRSRAEFRKIEIREAEPPRTVAEIAPSLKPRAVLEGHTKWVESFAFSPDDTDGRYQLGGPPCAIVERGDGGPNGHVSRG